MIISKAKPSDFEGIFLLLKELWSKETISKATTKKIYEKQVKEGKVVLIAKKEKIIGLITFSTILNIQSQGRIASIEELIVTKEKQNEGLGKQLIHAVQKEAKKLKCKEIHLLSTPKRKNAHKLYISEGFKTTSRLFWKYI